MRSFDAQREQCCLGFQCELRCGPQLNKILQVSLLSCSDFGSQALPHGKTYTLAE
nr:MAG TPA: hypothetical protein [Caudoviricetes sp.]